MTESTEEIVIWHGIPENMTIAELQKVHDEYRERALARSEDKLEVGDYLCYEELADYEAIERELMLAKRAKEEGL